MTDEYCVVNRFAVDGEELVAHWFRTGHVGMVSRSDFDRWLTGKPASAWMGHGSMWGVVERFLGRIRAMLVELLSFHGLLNSSALSIYGPERLSKNHPGPVVQIPTGALVRLLEIPGEWQEKYHLTPIEDALLFEGSREQGIFDRTFCFGNGVELSYQSLHEGQKVKILSCSWTDSLEPELLHDKMR